MGRRPTGAGSSTSPASCAGAEPDPRPGPPVARSTSYLEDSDQWWSAGHLRDVTRRAAGRGVDRPRRRAHADGSGVITPELVATPEAYPITIEVPELGVRATFERPGRRPGDRRRAGGAVERGAAAASTPTIKRAPGERVRLGSGFRTGADHRRCADRERREVIFRGMIASETYRPWSGFDEDHARADPIMMKQFGVNASASATTRPTAPVRPTSWALWVIDECDLEVRTDRLPGLEGQDPSDDGRMAGPCYLDRIERHGGARQEPPLRDHLVAGERGRHGNQSGGDVTVGARPRP